MVYVILKLFVRVAPLISDIAVLNYPFLSFCFAVILGCLNICVAKADSSDEESAEVIDSRRRLRMLQLRYITRLQQRANRFHVRPSLGRPVPNLDQSGYDPRLRPNGSLMDVVVTGWRRYISRNEFTICPEAGLPRSSWDGHYPLPSMRLRQVDAETRYVRSAGYGNLGSYPYTVWRRREYLNACFIRRMRNVELETNRAFNGAVARYRARVAGEMARRAEAEMLRRQNLAVLLRFHDDGIVLNTPAQLNEPLARRASGSSSAVNSIIDGLDLLDLN